MTPLARFYDSTCTALNNVYMADMADIPEELRTKLYQVILLLEDLNDRSLELIGDDDE